MSSLQIRFVLRAAATLVLALDSSALVPATSWAAGALAIGQTERYEGYGAAANYNTYAEAQRAALLDCQRSRSISRACRVVATFHDQCLAIAHAPSGKKGFGWAVARSRGAAQDRAMAICRRSSGNPKHSGCRIAGTGCDR